MSCSTKTSTCPSATGRSSWRASRSCWCRRSTGTRSSSRRPRSPSPASSSNPEDPRGGVSPAQLASAVAEAAAVIRDARNTSWEFESEPRAYAGVVLHRAGFVLAPAGLDFAQRALSRENGPEAEDLPGQVRKRWAGVSTDYLEQLSLGETAVDVQIARLAAVALRVRERAERARRDLADVATRGRPRHRLAYASFFCTAARATCSRVSAAL